MKDALIISQYGSKGLYYKIYVLMLNEVYEGDIHGILVGTGVPQTFTADYDQYESKVSNLRPSHKMTADYLRQKLSFGDTSYCRKKKDNQNKAVI